MTEKQITCQQRDDLFENNQPVSVYSSLTNFVGGEILDHRLPGHTATTWCDGSGRPFLREVLDAEGCRHWFISTPENVEPPGPGLYIPHDFIGSDNECEVCRNTMDHVVHLPTPENVEPLMDGTPVDTERANRNVMAHSQDALAFFRRTTPENVETLPVVNHHPLVEWPPYTHVSHGTVWTYYRTEHGDNWRNDGPAPENVKEPT